MIEAGKVLMYMLEKPNFTIKKNVKKILVRAQKGKRRAGEEASTFLENTYIIMYKMLVEIWMANVILMKFQMTMGTCYWTMDIKQFLCE